MCERELGEEDEEKIGEVVLFPWLWSTPLSPAHMKFVCRDLYAECYRCSIQPSASIMRNISIYLLEAHFCRGLSWVFILLNRFVIRRNFLLQNL